MLTTRVIEDWYDFEEQERLEKTIRWLLRRTATPTKLAASPASAKICRGTGVEDPVTAFRGIVLDALAGDDEIARRHRHVVIAVHFDQLGASAVARGMKISRRHLLRLKSEAVSAIARYVGRLFASLPPSRDNVLSIDRIDNLARLATSFNPSAANSIHRLRGVSSSAVSQQLALRGRLEQYVDVGEFGYEDFPDVAPPLVAACIDFCLASKGPSEDHTSETPRQPLQRYDAETKFELEYIAFLGARQRNRTLEMRAIANNLRRLAELRTEALSRALYCQADSSIRFGQIHEARDTLAQHERLTFDRGDAFQYSGCLTLFSKIELFEGRVAAAQELARAACCVFEGYREAYQAEIVVAESCFLQGKYWAEPHGVGELPAYSWERLAMEIERARSLTTQLDWNTAQEICESSASRTAEMGYVGLATRAAATLARCHEEQGLREGALKWQVEALRGLLEANDATLATNLFLRNGSRTSAPASTGIVDVLYDRLCLLLPQLLTDTTEQVDAVRALLSAMFECITLPGDLYHRLDDAVARLRASDAILARYILAAQPSFVTLFTLTATAFDVHQSTLSERVVGMVAYVADSTTMNAAKPAAPSRQTPAQRQYWPKLVEPERKVLVLGPSYSGAYR